MFRLKGALIIMRMAYSFYIRELLREHVESTDKRWDDELLLYLDKIFMYKGDDENENN
jgi:hypothetical protein